MRLPQFNYESPDTLEAVLAILDRERDNARILAGGTDLLVRMKKGLLAPGILVSLKRLDDLAYIREDGDLLRIGSRTPIIDILDSDPVRSKAPALLTACERIGAVSIQHYRGTIGGNILQDNRCIHYNQSAFHRSGRQPCHKDGGRICYAREEADRCNSTCQSDGATALMALGARLTLRHARGERQVDLENFYTTDGIRPFAMEEHEILTEIAVPLAGSDTVYSSAYQRLSYRSAIDYPIVCAGVRLAAESGKPDRIGSARIVVGAMGRSPLFLAKVSEGLAGADTGDKKAFQRAGKAARDAAGTFAVHNAGATLEYRISMVETMVARALEQAAETL